MSISLASGLMMPQNLVDGTEQCLVVVGPIDLQGIRNLRSCQQGQRVFKLTVILLTKSAAVHHWSSSKMWVMEMDQCEQT